jgi:hypothetical protein
MFAREFFSEPLRLVRVFNPTIDPQAEVKPIRLVPKAMKDVPKRQRVLAAGDCDQDLLVVRKHLIFFNEALRLLGHPLQIVLLA